METKLLLFLPGAATADFETAVAIIALGFLGYWLSRILVRSARHATDRLTAAQKTMAQMIAYDDQHQEQVFPMENTQLRSGDLLLIQPGERVPADCKILWGEGVVDESIITGESGLLNKGPKDMLTGGSLLVTGTVRVQVMAAGDESVLSHMIQLLKKTQGEKVPLQQLADRLRIVFIPAAGAIVLLSFLLNYWFLHAIAPSLMRSIAVLVIVCPFAIPFAAPSAIALGLGQAAGEGFLFRHAACLPWFKDIRQIVFNKTGTLTTGNFIISGWGMHDKAKATLSEELFKSIVCSLEKYSNHPIGQCIAREWKTKSDLRWARVEEVKGLGIRGETKTGDIYWAGSHKIFANKPVQLSEFVSLSDNAPGMNHADRLHDVYIIRNDEPMGWINVTDTVRPEAEGVIRWLHTKGIRTVLLSGARLEICQQVAATLGMDEVQAGQSPEDKAARISRLSQANPTLMVGDGINEAAAFANATVSISVSDASRLAIQTADVVLLNRGLTQVPEAISLGRHTFGIMQQNFYWVFLYAIVAIPVAAFGLILPVQAALVMGGSYLILLLNTMRLQVKRLQVNIKGRTGRDRP